MDIGVQIGVLGPLEIAVADQRQRVRRSKRRLVLARLVMGRGSPVSVDALIEELWPERPPPGAVNQIHVTVARIRAQLADREHTLLITGPAGYELLVADDELDVCRFEELTVEGERCLRSGDFQQAADRLAAALHLWRGPAYADVPQTELVRTEADRLAECRLEVQEARFDADLGRGARPARLVADLEAAVADHPLREHLWEQLMVALYRSGRQADALLAYRRVHDLLDDELGVRPGLGLAELQRRILEGDPALLRPAPSEAAPAAVDERAPEEIPRQLPADVVDFTGRRRELARLDAWLDSTAALVVTGGGGIGKTTLCLHWAHRSQERFPDGQLYLDLRGFADAPQLPAAQCLAMLLRGMGVRPEQIPVDLDEAAALYRTRLATRRMLIMLDNALDARQVDPLLAGGGPSRVLVTSRDRLTPLTARGVADRLDLGPLDDAGIRSLLGRAADCRRADPASLAELIKICAGLPLAARITGAQLAGDPHLSLADQVRELRGDAGRVRLSAMRLDGLSDTPESSIEATFDVSYRRLDQDSARLFALLGLLPGPDICVEAAAALSAADPVDVRRRLEGLCSRGMVQCVGRRRYAMHDLLRAYARQRCRADISAADRRTAERALLDWYVAAVAAAEIWLPSFVQVPGALPAVGSVPRFADPAESIAWLELERPNLRAAVIGWADDASLPVWQLTDALRSFLYYQSHVNDALEIGSAGLRSAELTGNVHAAAAAEHGMAQAWRAAGRYERAARHADSGLRLAERADWPDIAGSIWNEVALSAQQQGRARDSVAALRQAISSYQRAGNQAREVVPWINLGVTRLLLGDLRAAADGYRRIREELPVGPSDRPVVAVNLGEIYLLMGRLSQARSELEAAYADLQAAGRVLGVANATNSLAWLELESGRPERAAERLAAALDLSRREGSQRLEAQGLIIRAQLGMATGDLGTATTDAEAALRLSSDAASAYETVSAMVVLAALHCRLGRPGAASDLAARAEAIAREQEFRLQLGRALLVRSMASRLLGDPESARRSAELALALHRRCEYRRGIEEAGQFLAELAPPAIEPATTAGRKL